MTTAIEAVAQANALGAVPGLERYSYQFRSADSQYSIPSTIQAWGQVTAAPVSDSATAGFDSLLQVAGANYRSAAAGPLSTTTASVFDALNILQGSASDGTGQALDQLLSSDLVLAASAPDATAKTLLAGLAADYGEAAAPLGGTGTTVMTNGVSSDNQHIPAKAVTAAPGAATAAAPVASATPASSPAAPAETVPTAPDVDITVPGKTALATITPMSDATTGSASVAAQAPSPFASEFLVDAFARATSKIATSPAYAQTAAALYLNAAIYRSQHGADVTPLNTTRSIQPVAGIGAIYPV